MKFDIGDLAVYPAYGVGRIVAIETKTINDEKQNFYILKVLEDNMVIMIPIKNAESVGLRCLICENEVYKVYELIQNKKETPIDKQTWNRRYRDYMDKIKTGSIFEIAKVFRDLYLRRKTKDLSFGERKLLDTAQNLLVKELSNAKKIDVKTIKEEIESLLLSHHSVVEGCKITPTFQLS
ncbi:MAG: CarD family transcriptional regulator [Desulfobacterales bacterium]|nr:CarD family transcriptional regulator [Desulfobacterales bacterium]